MLNLSKQTENFIISPSETKKPKLPISRVVGSQSKCIMCKSVSGRNKITPTARLKVFIDYVVFIPKLKVLFCALEGWIFY